MKKTEQRAYIDGVCKELGLSMEQLAHKLNYKSLKRARWGEISLGDSKIRHIEDLLRMHRMSGAASVKPIYVGPSATSAVAGETTPVGSVSAATVLSLMPLETLRETSLRLLTAEPSEINFGALREIIDELERRAAAARSVEGTR